MNHNQAYYYISTWIKSEKLPFILDVDRTLRQEIEDTGLRFNSDAEAREYINNLQDNDPVKYADHKIGFFIVKPENVHPEHYRIGKSDGLHFNRTVDKLPAHYVLKHQDFILGWQHARDERLRNVSSDEELKKEVKNAIFERRRHFWIMNRLKLNGTSLAQISLNFKVGNSVVVNTSLGIRMHEEIADRISSEVCVPRHVLWPDWYGDDLKLNRQHQGFKSIDGVTEQLFNRICDVLVELDLSIEDLFSKLGHTEEDCSIGSLYVMSELNKLMDDGSRKGAGE